MSLGLDITVSVDGMPNDQLAQAGRVEVYERFGETTVFSIRYMEDIYEGDLNMLKEPAISPGSVLSISANVNDSMECLIKGPAHHQQIHLQHGGEGSWVEVSGSDTSITLDREMKSAIWDNVTDGDAVTSILGNYGLTPDVATTNTRHLEAKHVLVQRETDFRFIRRLARRNGCYFWVSCDAIGLETGHFKRPELNGQTVADLVINYENPNIETLDIFWDVERPTSVEGKQIDLNTKNDMAGNLAQSPQSMLGSDSLQTITADTRSAHVIAPGDDAGDLQGRSEGALIESDWFIRAVCRVNASRLGKIVHAGELVQIKGAGSRHSGKYLVYAVKHQIDAAGHIMEIELARNAWDSGAGGLGGGAASAIF